MGPNAGKKADAAGLERLRRRVDATNQQVSLLRDVAELIYHALDAVVAEGSRPSDMQRLADVAPDMLRRIGQLGIDAGGELG